MLLEVFSSYAMLQILSGDLDIFNEFTGALMLMNCLKYRISHQPFTRRTSNTTKLETNHRRNRFQKNVYFLFERPTPLLFLKLELQLVQIKWIQIFFLLCVAVGKLMLP